ncbi:uncharacterized protein LOC117106015 isoform X2 [Anneissia japonica]|uniref:uncharacterized protein LOC117106015 isoform X2 n=1 Tax=Anneissia japonica TaxID=1529436 RepID=UPI001425ACA7|nr:uncharacterized protein LOC117106015 isoform X2 [Anneissia japonica]
MSICRILLKKFRIPRQNPLTFQVGLVEREINEILRGQTQHEEVKRHVTRKPVAGPKNPYAGDKEQLEQRPITQDDVCPICQDELLGKHEPVTYCRFGCAKSVHIKCMKVWAEHQRSTGEEIIKCPLCREHFGPIDAIQEEYRNSSIRKTRAERLDLHLGSTCKKCGVAPIAGKCYKCCVCIEYYLCHACFLTPTHRDHAFQFRQKPSQRWRPAPRCSDAALPQAVIGDMENRELTDNDYEMLLQLDNETAHAPSTVPESFIKSLPSEMVRNGSGLLAPGSQCRVCLRAYIVGERVRRLPCQHKFHAVCIDPWLLHQRSTCPIDGATVYNPLMEALARDERRKKKMGQKQTDSAEMVLGRMNKKSNTGFRLGEEQVAEVQGLASTFALTGSSIISSKRPMPESTSLAQRSRMKKTSPAKWRSSNQKGDVMNSEFLNPLDNSFFQNNHERSNQGFNRERHLGAEQYGNLIGMVQLANEDTDIGERQFYEHSAELDRILHPCSRRRSSSERSRDCTPEREILQTRIETIQFDGSHQSSQRSSHWQRKPPLPPAGTVKQSVKPQPPSIPLLRQASITPVGNRQGSGSMSAPHYRQAHSDESPSNSDSERGRRKNKGKLIHRRIRSSSAGRRFSTEHLHPEQINQQQVFENMFLGSSTGKTLVGRSTDVRTRLTRPSAHRLRGGESNLAAVNSVDTGLTDMDIALTGQRVGSLQLQDDDEADRGM